METESQPEEQSTENESGGESTPSEESPKLSFSHYFKNYVMLLILGGGILLLDQWSKNWVRANLSIYESWMPLEWLAPYLRIINAENTGAAFGLFKQGGGVITVLAIVVSLVIIYYFPRIPDQERFVKLALGLQLGGALGNLYDRLFYGPVTDFIAVGRFPVFNVADSSISTGVAVLIIGVWLSERKEKLARRIELQESQDLELGEQV